MCTSSSILLPIHRSHRVNTRQQIKCLNYQRSIDDLRQIYVRASHKGDGRKGNWNKEAGVGDANTDAPSCEEAPESKSLRYTNSPEPAKEELRAGNEKAKPRADKLGFQNDTPRSKKDDVKKPQRPKQQIQKGETDVRMKMVYFWQTMRKPQNMLAVFLTGLLLYAITSFGWQVMVVAVDVTLFVLKCSFVAFIFLLIYICLL